MTRLALLASLLTLSLSLGPLAAAERRPASARRDQPLKEADCAPGDLRGGRRPGLPQLGVPDVVRAHGATGAARRAAPGRGGWTRTGRGRSALSQHAPIGQRQRLRDDRRRIRPHQSRLSQEARRRARGPGRRRDLRWIDRVVRGRGHRAHAQSGGDQARGLPRVAAARPPAGHDRRRRSDPRRALGDRRRRPPGAATGLRRGPDLGAAGARLLPGGARGHVPRSIAAGAPGGVRRSAGRHPGRR